MLYVFLVEDDASCAEQIRAAFEHAAIDCELSVASSFAEAGVLLVERTPDLVIVDIDPPDGRGADLFGSDAEQFEFPILFLSGEGTRRTLIEIESASVLRSLARQQIELTALPDIATRCLLERRGGEVPHETRAGAAAQLAAARRETIHVAVESAMSGVSRLDDSGRFVTASDTYTEMLGYDPGDLIGTSWTRTIHPDDAPTMADAIQEMSATGRAEVEVRALCKDGTPLHMHALLAIRRGRDGVVDGHYCFTRNIEARVRALEQKRELEEQLRQSQKLEAVGTLASGVAHDFNNVLFAINGYVDLAIDTLPADNTSRSWLAKVKQACDQASGLTRSLLTFAQKAPATKTHVDWVASTDETIGLLRRLLPASVELEPRLPDSPAWIWADPNQIQQVLVNLTINARDSMIDGGKLHIELSQTLPAGFEDMLDSDETDGFSYLSVIDSGTGIPEEIRSRVLEPFFTTKRRDKGTGLGLSVVHGIITDHDGHIQFTSGDSGTHFVIALPRCGKPSETIDSVKDAHYRRGSGQLVLLAEDDQHALEILVRGFEDAGYRVVSAGDGDEVLRLFAQHNHDIAVAVLDVDLPKRSGLSCIEELRRERPDLPIVIESGRLDPDMTSLENLSVLSKPFPMSELLRAVDQAIAGRTTPRSSTP